MEEGSKRKTNLKWPLDDKETQILNYMQKQANKIRDLGPILGHCPSLYKEREFSDWLAILLFLQKSYQKTIRDKRETEKKTQRQRVSNNSRIQQVMKK